MTSISRSSDPTSAALMMSLGALCIFIWGVFSGAFSGPMTRRCGFYQREMEDDG